MDSLLDYIARYVNEHEAEYQEWLKKKGEDKDDNRRTSEAAEHST